MDKHRRLIDRKCLGQIHPALASKWRVDWLIRTRKIPIVRIGRSIFFDQSEIEAWIEGQKIPACGGE